MPSIRDSLHTYIYDNSDKDCVMASKVCRYVEVNYLFVHLFL